MAKKKEILPRIPGSYIAYTDGGCAVNPGGPGGIGVVILTPEKEEFLISRGYWSTTNNRMEMRAVIEALSMIPEGAAIDLYSDSQYVINTMTKGWKKNKNQDLWKKMDCLVQEREIQWHWVQGHNGDQYNELCDKLATQGIESLDKNTDIGYDAPGASLPEPEMKDSQNAQRASGFQTNKGTPIAGPGRSQGTEKQSSFVTSAMTIPVPDSGDVYTENPFREQMLNPCCVCGIRKFYKEKKHSFRDYKELRIGGVDQFSRAGFVQLIEFIPESHLDLIRSFFQDERDALAAARWHVRGLTVQDSIRKALVDKEISENAKRRSRP